MSLELGERMQMLRAVELRTVGGGADPDQVRELLNEAADVLATAELEQAELRNEVERIREANDEAVVGKALVTATRAGEALVAEAREEAASLVAEAEAQASALLEQVKAQAEQREQETKAAWTQFERELTSAKRSQEKELAAAQAEADAALGDARRELSQLERKATQLSSLVADMERRIVEIAQHALEELEAFSASGSTEDDLLADLQPAPETSDVAVE
jgi:cell division septum initiation protein DivIVA